MTSYSTLYQALCRADRSTLEKELTDVATANARDTAGRTLLHDAILLGLPDMVETLLQRGADLTVRHALGGTPLHSLAWAVQNPGYPVKRMLAALSVSVPRPILDRVVGNAFPRHSLSADPRLNLEAAYAAINQWIDGWMNK